MELASRFPRLRIAVLEKERSVAFHQTGHNSGVIHSGVYYHPGSLKAQFCVQGAAEMIRFCDSHDIPYEICGKVIVATDEKQRSALEELRHRASANNVPNVRLLTREELRDFEPNAAGVAALLVPGTAITLYKRVAEKYAELAASRGVEVLTDSGVDAIRVTNDTFTTETNSGAYDSRFLINCAGL